MQGSDSKAGLHLKTPRGYISEFPISPLRQVWKPNEMSAKVSYIYIYLPYLESNEYVNDDLRNILGQWSHTIE